MYSKDIIYKSYRGNNMKKLLFSLSLVLALHAEAMHKTIMISGVVNHSGQPARIVSNESNGAKSEQAITANQGEQQIYFPFGSKGVRLVSKAGEWEIKPENQKIEIMQVAPYKKVGLHISAKDLAGIRRIVIDKNGEPLLVGRYNN